MLALLDDRDSANSIGAACLRALSPHERSPDQLVSSICGAAGLGLDDLSSPDLGRRIGDQVRRDFSRAEMVQVDGWFLSVTEARFYALSAAA